MKNINSLKPRNCALSCVASCWLAIRPSINAGPGDLSGMCVAVAAHLLEFHCVVAGQDCSSPRKRSQHSYSLLVRSQHSQKILQISNT